MNGYSMRRFSIHYIIKINQIERNNMYMLSYYLKSYVVRLVKNVFL